MNQDSWVQKANLELGMEFGSLGGGEALVIQVNVSQDDRPPCPGHASRYSLGPDSTHVPIRKIFQGLD